MEFSLSVFSPGSGGGLAVRLSVLGCAGFLGVYCGVVDRVVPRDAANGETVTSFQFFGFNLFSAH